MGRSGLPPEAANLDCTRRLARGTARPASSPGPVAPWQTARSARATSQTPSISQGVDNRYAYASEPWQVRSLESKLFAFCDRGMDRADCLALTPTGEELQEALAGLKSKTGTPIGQSTSEMR